MLVARVLLEVVKEVVKGGAESGDGGDVTGGEKPVECLTNLR